MMSLHNHPYSNGRKEGRSRGEKVDKIKSIK